MPSQQCSARDYTMVYRDCVDGLRAVALYEGAMELEAERAIVESSGAQTRSRRFPFATEVMMNSPAPLPDAPVQLAAAQIAAESTDAVNDPVADPLVEAEENDTYNPLWTVVIGMACLFGVFAALLALG